MVEYEFQEWYKDQVMPSDEELNELEHYGVKGQKWGVRRTPAQLGHVTEKKRKVTNWIEKARKKSAKRKKQAAKKKAAAKIAKAEKQEESEEKIREKVLKSTDPNYIYKNRHLLTTKELQDRLTRIDTEAKVKKLTDNSKTKKTLKSGEDAMKSLGVIAENLGKMAEAYKKVDEARSKVEKRAADAKKAQSEAAEAAKKEAADAKKAQSEAAEAAKKEAAARLKKTEEERSSFVKKRNDVSNTPISAVYASTKGIEIRFDPKTGAMSFVQKKR